MIHHPIDPHRLLTLGNLLMVGGVLVLLIGICGAYLLDQQLPLGIIIASHALIILGPTALKIGYIVRLLAQRQVSFAA